MAAEESGRSSAHCNLLDVLHGYAMIHSASSRDKYNESSVVATNVNAADSKSYNSRLPWEKLAAFAFGKHWYLGSNHSTSSNDNNRCRNEQTPQTRDSHTMNGNGTKNYQDVSTTKCWNAPYLDEVPLFPMRHGQSIRRKVMATSSSLIRSASSSNRNHVDRGSACAANNDDNSEDRLWGDHVIADDMIRQRQQQEQDLSKDASSASAHAAVSTIADGKSASSDKPNVVDGVSSAVRVDTKEKSLSGKQDGSTNGSPATKRVKLDITSTKTSSPSSKKLVAMDTQEGDSMTIKNINHHNISMEREHADLLLMERNRFIVPSFCPPFPATHTFVASRKSMDEASQSVNIIENNLEKKAQVHQIRQNLIKLDDSITSDAKNLSDENMELAKIIVPFGKVSSSTPKSTQQVLNPLQRPSGTRVSRMLEGSMDVA